jgi:hypothetical protein
MDLANFGKSEQPAVVPVAGFQTLPVNPARGIRITADLVVLPEGLGPDCPPLLQQHLDLPQDEGVALQRSGVMSLLMPDVVPDRLGLLGAGKPPVTLIELR